MNEKIINLRYNAATLDDLQILIDTRINVLIAANKLEAGTDMSEVRKNTEDYYKYALADGSHFAVLVYDENQSVVGTGGISYYHVMPTYCTPDGRKAYIMNMYTAPQYRRQGIAMKTLDILVKDAVKRGIKHITLETTEMGRPLYEKYGFVVMDDEMILESIKRRGL